MEVLSAVSAQRRCEHSVIDSAIHEKPLPHIRFIRVQIDEPPRREKRCGKQDGELPLLCHFNGLYVVLYLASRHAQTLCQ
jgi:hypothetical protein